MNIAFRLFALCLVAFSCLSVGHAANPVIAHEAPVSIMSGSPVKIIARVSAGSEKIESVILHVAPAPAAEQVELTMLSAGANMYYANIQPNQLGTTREFKYYIEAATSKAVVESDWYTVRVTGQTSAVPAPAEKKSGGVSKPLLIAGGGAVAVIAGVALIGDSGGDGGGGGNSGGDTGGNGGGDVGDQVVVRTASDRVDAANATIPKIVTVQADGEIGGRTIDRVRVRVEFNAEDGAEETFEAIYNNGIALSGATSATQTVQQDVAGAESSEVQIWVLTSQAGENGQNKYSWTATVTYFVSP